MVTKYLNPYVLIFLVAIVSANLVLYFLGPIPWAMVNGFIFIGLDFVIRDKLHEIWETHLWKRMLGLIFTGSAISVFFNLGAIQIAIASFIAFLVAGMVDAVIYHALKDKKWLIKSNASNAGGSIADSILFPTIAFGSFMPEVILGQIASKFLGGLVWSYVITKIRK